MQATALQATNIRVPKPCILSLCLSLIFTCLTDNVAMSLSRTPKMHPTLRPPLHVDDIHAAYRVSRTAGEENRAQLQDSRWLWMVATSLSTVVTGELSRSRGCCCPWRPLQWYHGIALCGRASFPMRETSVQSLRTEEERWLRVLSDVTRPQLSC